MTNCCTLLARLGSKMINMTSTLVETVSINYEDFNESFLTCGTCLCMYDGGEHTPKLLPCSHTVCLQCLGRIASSQTRDDGTFRCPICRELIGIPRGGVSALPPSFLVNQLLDLMSRQRRHVIPKCATHIAQELLFCETCDTVFCSLCVGGSHQTGGASGSSTNVKDPDTSSSSSSSSQLPASEHTVIPFSIAIKRMSEILLYKANECVGKLDEASGRVEAELAALELSVESGLADVNRCFQEAVEVLEKRREAVLEEVRSVAQAKQKVLAEQLELISAERSKVQAEVEGLHWQVEVRHISRRIAELGAKLDSVSTLGEPRENAFLLFESDHGPARGQLAEAAASLGRVRSSSTLPGLCSLEIPHETPDSTLVAGLETSAIFTAVDLNGRRRTNGGDPLMASLVPDEGPTMPVAIEDEDDGTYILRFRPPPGVSQLQVTLFGRPVRGSPLVIEASVQHPPVAIYGSRGSGKRELVQPVAIATSRTEIYVLDTGNSRIQVLDVHLEPLRQLDSSALEGRSGTGLAWLPTEELAVVNWRTKTVSVLNPGTGETRSSFTCSEFLEPVSLAAAGEGCIAVGDHAAGAVFVMDVATGQMVRKVANRKVGVAAVAVSSTGEILVADSTIVVFSSAGKFLREINAEGKGKGRYGGICVDSCGRVLASRSEKGRSFVQVFRINDGHLLCTIDSFGAKLKRPSGVAPLPDGGHLLVADLGNDCLKQFRYV